MRLLRRWLDGIDAIEEVALAKHLQSVVGEGNVLCGPGAEVPGHQAEGLAGGHPVHVSTALQNEDGRGEQDDDDPEPGRFHDGFAFTGEISRMAR